MENKYSFYESFCKDLNKILRMGIEKIFLAFFLLILPFASCLYMNLDGKQEHCFYVTIAEGLNLTISYVVSGYN